MVGFAFIRSCVKRSSSTTECWRYSGFASAPAPRRVLNVAVMLLVSCSAARLWAEEAPASQSALTWLRLEGAGDCPGPAVLARRVNALLKRSAFVEPASATRFFQAAVRANDDAPGWHVSIVVSDDANATLGTRDLSVPQAACSDAVDAAALALALMIDPNFNAAVPALPGAPGAHAAPSPSAANSSSATVDEAVKRERAALPQADRSAAPAPIPLPAPSAESAPVHWRTRLGLAFLSGIGTLPRTSLGAIAGVRVSPALSSIGIEFSAGYVGEQRAELRPGAGGEFNAMLGALGVWLEPWSRGRLDLSLAAGAHAWRILGCGFGFTSNNGCESSWVLSAGLDMELAWKFTERWGLSVRPGVGVPVVRDTFQATGPNGAPKDVFRPASVIGWLTLGIVVEP
jgi:hypothetical protein